MSDAPIFRILVSSKARDMLFEHARFLAQASIQAAGRLFDQFEEKVSSLEMMPERCAYYDNPYIQPGKYRKLSLGNYLLILFQVIDKIVYIELIIDARAENKSLVDY
jgi:hypothetical protein